MNAIAKKTLNKLIDTYERSKSFRGDNKVNQNFTVEVKKLFPIYQDDSQYDKFYEINESLAELEQNDLVHLSGTKNGVIKKVTLNIDTLQACYIALNRRAKSEDNQYLVQLWDELEASKTSILRSYIAEQHIRMKKNISIQYYVGNHEDYRELLQLIQAIEENENEYYVREFSMRLFGKSKRVEELQSKAQALLFQYGEFEEKEFVFEECGIVKTPTYVMMKGNGNILLRGQNIDLAMFQGDIGLSTVTLSEVTHVEVKGKRVVTIENMTSFHNYDDKDDFIIYLGGFHNRVKRQILTKIYCDNKEKEYRHFGDIDAGGFYILEHLKRKTQIPFRSLNMNIRTLEKHRDMWQRLTENDKKRLKQLMMMNQQTSKNNIEDYSEVICFMLENDCKLEQEAN